MVVSVMVASFGTFYRHFHVELSTGNFGALLCSQHHLEHFTGNFMEPVAGI